MTRLLCSADTQVACHNDFRHVGGCVGDVVRLWHALSECRHMEGRTVRLKTTDVEQKSLYRDVHSHCPAPGVPILFHQFRFFSTSVVAPTTVFDKIRRVWSFHGPSTFCACVVCRSHQKDERVMLRASVECRLRLVYAQLCGSSEAMIDTAN